MSVYLPVFLIGCLTIYMSVLSIYLSIYLSVSLSIYLPVWLSIYLSVYISICLSDYMSCLVFIYLPVSQVFWGRIFRPVLRMRWTMILQQRAAFCTNSTVWWTFCSWCAAVWTSLTRDTTERPSGWAGPMPIHKHNTPFVKMLLYLAQVKGYTPRVQTSSASSVLV